MLVLLLKVLIAPLLVLAGSLAQRRFGPIIGGRLVGLPLTSLPLLALMTLSQGRSFAGSAAASTLAAGVAQSVWALTYAVSSRRWSAGWSTLSATATFAAVCGLLYLCPLPTIEATVLSSFSVLAALLIWPRPSQAQAGPSRAGHPLAARMAAAAAFTFAVAESASVLGSRSAGLVGALPVLSIVLAVGIHRREGAEASNRFLEGVMEGSLSVVAALAVLAFFLTVAGPMVAFPLAIGASFVAQMIPLGRIPRLHDMEGVVSLARRLA